MAISPMILLLPCSSKYVKVFIILLQYHLVLLKLVWYVLTCYSCIYCQPLKWPTVTALAQCHALCNLSIVGSQLKQLTIVGSCNSQLATVGNCTNQLQQVAEIASSYRQVAKIALQLQLASSQVAQIASYSQQMLLATGCLLQDHATHYKITISTNSYS